MYQLSLKMPQNINTSRHISRHTVKLCLGFIFICILFLYFTRSSSKKSTTITTPKIIVEIPVNKQNYVTRRYDKAEFKHLEPTYGPEQIKINRQIEQERYELELKRQLLENKIKSTTTTTTEKEQVELVPIIKYTPAAPEPIKLKLETDGQINLKTKSQQIETNLNTGPPPLNWELKQHATRFPLKLETKNCIDLKELLVGPLAQDDVRIINYIKENYILNPPSNKEYNLKNRNKDPSLGQSSIVMKIFNNKRNGLFVDYGNSDGETLSNTLYLEKEYGWKGLLIEGDPAKFKILKDKQRKAWTANVCLSIKPFPHQMIYKTHPDIITLLADASMKQYFNETKDQITMTRDDINVQCFPLFTLLSVLKVSSIDYFSLSVENNLEILQTIPFDRILIKILSVEYIYAGVDKSQILTEFMTKKGYRFTAKVNDKSNSVNDLVFAHNSVMTDQMIHIIQTEAHKPYEF